MICYEIEHPHELTPLYGPLESRAPHGSTVCPWNKQRPKITHPMARAPAWLLLLGSAHQEP